MRANIAPTKFDGPTGASRRCLSGARGGGSPLDRSAVYTKEDIGHIVRLLRESNRSTASVVDKIKALPQLTDQQGKGPTFWIERSKVLSILKAEEGGEDVD